MGNAKKSSRLVLITLIVSSLLIGHIEKRLDNVSNNVIRELVWEIFYLILSERQSEKTRLVCYTNNAEYAIYANGIQRVNICIIMCIHVRTAYLLNNF